MDGSWDQWPGVDSQHCERTGDSGSTGQLSPSLGDFPPYLWWGNAHWIAHAPLRRPHFRVSLSRIPENLLNAISKV